MRKGFYYGKLEVSKNKGIAFGVTWNYFMTTALKRLLL